MYVNCRNSSLVSLMDRATSFPSGLFGTDKRLLSALGALDLQSRVTPIAALEMARFVEAASQKDRSHGLALYAACSLPSLFFIKYESLSMNQAMGFAMFEAWHALPLSCTWGA